MEIEDSSQVVEKIKTQLTGEFLAEYQLKDLLGRGGMGVVYRAVQLTSGREVAIKFMSGGLFEGDDAEVRFFHEAKAMQDVDHPNLVEVLASGKDGDLPYIVFEFVAGRTLKDVVQEAGKVPVMTALKVAKGILQGLKVAHTRQIIHRDIKAENILLGEDGVPKVADFGIAKSDRPQQTKTGVIIGTPAYMAPEQAKGTKLDQRCDIYSTGIVLFEMLTGQLPFGEENSMTTMMAHINEPVPAPSYLVPGMPQLLDDLLAGALAKRPEDRYPSAGGFAIAVDRTLERLEQAGFAGVKPGGSGTAGATQARTAPTQGRPAPPGTGAVGSQEQTAGTRAVHLGSSALAQEMGGTGAVDDGSTRVTHVDDLPTGAQGGVRTLGQSTVRVLESTRAQRQGTAAVPRKIEDRNPVKWIAAGAGVLLVLVVGAAAMLRGGGEEGPKPADVLGGPEAKALEARLDELADPDLEAEDLRSLLRRLPDKVEPGVEPLRELAVRRIEVIRDATPPDPETEFHFHLALAALGDVRGYAGALEYAEGNKTSKTCRYAFQAVADGMERGRYPDEEQGEELDDALWSSHRGPEALAKERAQFFRAVTALGTDVSVANLEEILRIGERKGYPVAFQKEAMGALQDIAISKRPGAPAAKALLQAGVKGRGKVRLTDDETLDAVRRITEGMETVQP